MSRDEYIINDIMRNVCFVGSFLSMVIACAGKAGIKATRQHDPEFAHKAFVCSFFKLFVVVASCCFMHHQGKELKQAFRHYKSTHPQQYKEETQSYPRYMRGGRNLEAEAETEDKDFWMKIHGNNAVCGSVASQNACDETSGCTWCRSAAVRSACDSIEDAKQLPSAIFACDGISAEEKPSESESDEETQESAAPLEKLYQQSSSADCSSISEEDSCDNQGCSWCRSDVAKPVCHTRTIAKQLPASYFTCSNIRSGEEKESMYNNHEGHGERQGRTCPFKVVLMFTIVAYWVSLRRYIQALREFKAQGGVIEPETGCKWFKACETTATPVAQVAQAPAPIPTSINYSINSETDTQRMI